MRLDRRTLEGKAIEEVEAALVAQLGLERQAKPIPNLNQYLEAQGFEMEGADQDE